ncbi:MAG: VCBS repeat-containing protein [Saprospiraceae bacterium]|nr:VCBS repeat-containing protein [Saprospiraceae bacterium]
MAEKTKKSAAKISLKNEPIPNIPEVKERRPTSLKITLSGMNLQHAKASKVAASLKQLGLRTLADVRAMGGLGKLKKTGITPALRERIDAHANLDLLLPNPKINNLLIDKGYKHILDIAETPEVMLLADLKDQLPEAKILHLSRTAGAQIALMNHAETQRRVFLANRMEVKAGAKLFTSDPATEEPCECNDCDATVSPRAYLADLMNYAVKHVQAGNKKLTLADFKAIFLQPFSELPADCSAIDTEVRQVRIAVEVLRALGKKNQDLGDFACSDTQLRIGREGPDFLTHADSGAIAFAADVDGDGIQELIVAKNSIGGTGENDFWVVKYNPDGQFWFPFYPIDSDFVQGVSIRCTPTQFVGSNIITHAIAADVDGDGCDEIVVAFNNGETDPARPVYNNECWVIKFNKSRKKFEFIGNTQGFVYDAAIDCSYGPDGTVRNQYINLGIKSIIAADVDGDGQHEIVIQPQYGNKYVSVTPVTSPTVGNDMWVLKYNKQADKFEYFSPIPGHPFNASIDCSPADYDAKKILAVDIKGDGKDRVLAFPDHGLNPGKMIWIMKYDGAAFVHEDPSDPIIFNVDVEIDWRVHACGSVAAGDFDGQNRMALVAAPEQTSLNVLDKNALKVVSIDLDFTKQHLIANNIGTSVASDAFAQIDCSPGNFKVRKVLTGDIDGDGRHEVIVVPEFGQSTWQNGLWIMDYDPIQNQWQHFSPIAGNPINADLVWNNEPNEIVNAIICADINGDGKDELIVFPSSSQKEYYNSFWALEFDVATQTWKHIKPKQVAENQYVLNAYQALLEEAGTSYAEIRLARNQSDDDPEKVNLADRIGIPVGNIKDLLLDPDSIKESDLQALFGLADTHLPPLQARPAPKIVQWRQETLQKLWEQQDWRYDDFSAILADGSPNLQRRVVIDPDTLGPDDFRHPEVGAGFQLLYPKTAFELWVVRRKWLDGLLEGFRSVALKFVGNNRGPDLAAIIIAKMGTTSYQNPAPNGLWTFAPALTPIEIFEDLKSIVKKFAEENDSTKTRKINEDLFTKYHLTIEPVRRLVELWKKDLDFWLAPDLNAALAGEEWEEVYNILALAHKAWWQDYHVFINVGAWQTEEDGLKITLSPKDFWMAFRKPSEGTFPPIRQANTPLLDPEKIKLEDLPDSTASKTAAATLEARKLELKNKRDKFRTDFETSEDFEALVVAALGNAPAPAGNWLNYFSDLDQKLASPATAAAAQSTLKSSWKLSEDAFHRLLAAFNKQVAFLADKSHNPPLNSAESEDLYLILGTSFKELSLYQKWYNEEVNQKIEPWLCIKHSLAVWRTNTEDRQVWEQALRQHTKVPIIDPDVIDGRYFQSTQTSDPAVKLWQARVKAIRKEYSKRAGTNKDLAKFDAQCDADLGKGVLQELETALSEKRGIAVRAAQLDLSLAMLKELIQLRQVLEKNASAAVGAVPLPVLDEEWGNVASILTQVWKVRRFSEWKAEEQAAGVSLSPQFFRIPELDFSNFPPPQPRPLDRWRATPDMLSDWLDTLQSRIDQFESIKNTQKQSVGRVEEALLPSLRDALLAAYVLRGSTIEEKAKWLGDRLGIAMNYGGCYQTTRITQAIETFQTLLWGLRTEVLRDAFPYLWLNNYQSGGNTFDEEWKWIGSYATWRAAMFVYLYPENILMPQLRRYQSPGFQKLITNFRNKRKISARDVLKFGKEYYDYFNDICQLATDSNKLFWCISGVNTRIYGAEKSIALREHPRPATFYWAISVNSGNLYWSVQVEPPNGSYAQSFWEELSVFNFPIDSFVGARVFQIEGNGRFLFLFAITKDIEKTQIEFAKLNLQSGVWDDEATPLNLPNHVKTFEARLFANVDEKTAPEIEIKVSEQVVYRRSLSPSGDGWTSTDFNNAVIKGHWEDLGVQIPAQHDVNLLCDQSGRNARFWTAGDFDGDGNDELLIAMNNPGDPPSQNDFWCMDYQNGKWQNLPDLNGSDDPEPAFFARAGDFNGDGKDEALIFSIGNLFLTFSLRLFALENGKWTTLANFNNNDIPVDTILVGKFSSPNAHDELLIKRFGRRTLANDFNFWKFENGGWTQLGTLDCGSDSQRSGLFNTEAHFAIKGDFDGDGQDEVAICLRPSFVYTPPNGVYSNLDSIRSYDVDASKGNDFWVRKYRNGIWDHLGEIQYPDLDLQFDCSVEGVPAAFAVAGDFDGDGMDEIMVFSAITDGLANYTIWTMDFAKSNNNSAPFYGGKWNPMKSIDLLNLKGRPAASAVAGDFDGDGVDEVAIFIEGNDTIGNDGYIFKFLQDRNVWVELPILDFSISQIAASTVLSGKFSGKKISGQVRDEIAAMPSQQQRKPIIANRWYAVDNAPSAETIELDGSRREIPKWEAIASLPANNSVWVRGFVREFDPYSIRSCDTNNLKPKGNPDLSIPYFQLHTSSQVRDIFAISSSINETNSDRNKAYLEEAFYFVPIHIALQLQNSGLYIQALDWFRQVYDYNQPGAYRKLIGLSPDDPNINDDYLRNLNDWLLDPLNPHAIAKIRHQAYTRFTLLSIIHCLLAYADAEFIQDTAESVPRARELYEEALTLLDSPELKSHRNECDQIEGEIRIEIEDPHIEWVEIEVVSLVNSMKDIVAKKNAIKAINYEFAKGNDPVKALNKVKAYMADNASSPNDYASLLAKKTESALNAYNEGLSNWSGLTTMGDFGWITKPEYYPSDIFDFCIPPNPMLRALRLRANLNLYKLTHCQNIAGMRRQVEFYAAPTDSSSGLPTIGGDGRLSLPNTARLQPTPYRYVVLSERAKQLANLAMQIEASFLSALEKRDQQAFELLRARQDIRLAQSSVRTQDLRVVEAQNGVKLAELQKERSQISFDTYEQWLSEGFLSEEETLFALYDWLAVSKSVLSIANTAYKIASVPKDLTALTGSTAVTIGSIIAGGVAEIAATILENQISRQSLSLSKALRDREYQFQKSLAAQDIRIGDQTITIANDRVRIVEQERTIEQMKADNAKEVFDFLSNKFTNEELYDWMSQVLEGVYSYFLQQATAIAQLAASQLAFERQETPTSFIQNDYWEVLTGDELQGSTGDSTRQDRRGLTGSARLLQDIYLLDQYAFDKNIRKQQITKTISLATLDPIAFQQFRQTGVLPFVTSMEMFDRDFPGHYLRLIKRARTTVVALVPPVQGIKAVLSSGGISRTVIGGDIFQTVIVRRDPESVALSAPNNATGVFEMQDQQQSEMLLPFEGLGVAGSWEFKMPKAANAFDYSTIADVLITLEYTALNSFDYRAQTILKLNAKRNISAYRAYSFRDEFADAWYDLHNPDLSDSPMVVEMETQLADFPANLERVKIEDVSLLFARKDGTEFELANVELFFFEHGSNARLGGDGNTNNGILNSQRAGKWKMFQGKNPVGKWRLSLTDSEEIKGYFNNNFIEDIMLVITYTARYPEWV